MTLSSSFPKELSRATIAAVRAVSKDVPEFTLRVSRAFQDGWYEPMRVHNARLNAFLAVVSGLRGKTQKRIRRWDSITAYQQAIEQIITDWTDFTIPLYPSPEEGWQALNSLEHGPDIWLSFGKLPDLDLDVKNIRDTRKELQGRKRLHTRAK